MESKKVLTVLKRLKRENERSLHGERIKNSNTEALKIAIEVIEHKRYINFTKSTLDLIMDEIVEEYFSDETIEYGYGLMDVIEAVEAKYSEEIATLPR